MSTGISQLAGTKIRKIIEVYYEKDGDKPSELIFINNNCRAFKMYHEQDCYEYVYLDEIIGDLSDIVGQTIVMAEERTQKDDSVEDGSATWTFYEIKSNKGAVTLRWYGASNGYYSENVDFETMENQDFSFFLAGIEKLVIHPTREVSI